MITKIKLFFLNIWARYLIWKKEKEISKEFNNSISYSSTTVEHHEDAIQRAVTEGVSRIKNKINTMVEKGDSYDTVLRKMDMLTLAENNEGQETVKILRNTFVYKQEKTKEAMIDDRINHYYQLQKHKLDREKWRSQRKYIQDVTDKEFETFLEDEEPIKWN